jgi:hypothetical protein
MNFYNRLNAERNDDTELQTVIKSVVRRLNSQPTSDEKPAVLLGKIQSGKTRGFIGVIAEAFDYSFDIAIVLTKNSTLLGKQTTMRLAKEFKQFIDTYEFDQIHYVNDFSGVKLTPAQLLQKHIFVGIKNPTNIKKLITSFTKTNPELAKKRVLIVDDEADYGSIGFKKVKGEEPDMIKTAKFISEFRDKLTSYSFLQVTATPYSLYLQPEEYPDPVGQYKPNKPAFTEVLPTHGAYIGGEYYFEENQDVDSPASDLHITSRPLDIKTLAATNPDDQILKNVFTTDLLQTFRKSVLNFLIGVGIRRVQFIKDNDLPDDISIIRLPRYAFVFHIDTGKDKMVWQQGLITKYLELLCEYHRDQPALFEDLIKPFYNDLSGSVQKGNLKWGDIYVPTFQETLKQIVGIIDFKDYTSFLVNSDEKVINLADENGQLRLVSGLNFFIGGQVLDRGITIDSLIGFFYGRDPQSSKMDTILQHARMYGARNKKDLCITRFYTTYSIYKTMEEIHQMDSALREQLIKNDQGVIFIQRSTNGKIVPCDPSRIMFSNLVTVKSFKRLLPYGFQVRTGSALKDKIDLIDVILRTYPDFTLNKGELFEINYSHFCEIIDLIDSSYSGFDLPDLKWDIVLIKDLVKRFLDEVNSDKVHIYVQENRAMGKFKATGDYISAPETATTDGQYAKNAAQNRPCLILLKQNGRSSNPVWNDGPFYWPVVYCPKLNKPLIFSWDQN